MLSSIPPMREFRLRSPFHRWRLNYPNIRASGGYLEANLFRSVAFARVASRYVQSPASHYPAETRGSRSAFRIRRRRRLGHRSNRAEQESLELALGCSLIRFGQSSRCPGSNCSGSNNRDSHTSNPNNKDTRNHSTPILDTNTERNRRKNDDGARRLRHVGASYRFHARSHRFHARS
jgi:hypothetical protein